MINFVVSGRFTFPEGMASTKRIKNYLSYLNNQERIQTSVLLLWNNDKNIKQFGTDYKYERTFVKIVGLNVVANLANFLFLPFGNLLAIFFLISKIREQNILLIYDGISYSNIFFVIVAKMIGYRIIVDIVEDYQLHQEKMSFGSILHIWSIKYLERLSLKFIDGIIVISSYLFKKYETKLQQNVPIVNIPVSAMFDFPSLEFNDPQYAKIFYGGGNGVKDGLKYLILAFNGLKKKFPNIKLYLTGVPDSELKKTLDASGIDFLGFLPEIEYYQLIRKMDILCIPRINSEYANAGFPFKLAEFLASGKIVVASKISDLGLYLKDRESIFFVTPENVQDLQNTIENILLEWEKSKKIALQGYLVGKSYFDVGVVGNLLEKFLYKVIDE